MIIGSFHFGFYDSHDKVDKNYIRYPLKNKELTLCE